MIIREFQGEFRFLSNFYPSRITIDDREYPTVEHYYQSQKAKNARDASAILHARSPGEARRMGRKCVSRGDWERVNAATMEIAVRAKFRQHPDLAAKLVATGDATLQEGNKWGDTFWGVDLRTGNGKNHLGNLLMQVRDDLRRATSSPTR